VDALACRAVSSASGPALGGDGRTSAALDLPDELRADVRLLGEILGEVLVEYGGQGLLDDVVALRRLVIAAHDANAPGADGETAGDEAADQAQALVSSWPLPRAEEVARAFAVFFHLVNLAEEHHRTRMMQAASATLPVPGGVGAAVAGITVEHGTGHAQAMLAGLEVHPVLTAHPTEARRRSTVRAIRRIATLLGERDDPRLSTLSRADLRRRLLEEVDSLWRTGLVRLKRPGPLDEVRTAMAVFDEVLFAIAPAVYRRAETEIAGDSGGRTPPQVPAFLTWGSWIGGDRDGNPNVTASVTRQAMAIQSEHVLRALEDSTTRIAWAMTADPASTPPSPGVQRLIDDAADRLPETIDELAVRAPNEPHRLALLVAAERIRATRHRNADAAYAGAPELLADLTTVQRSLAAAGAPRLAYGELQHLVWQVETFGFHLAELEVRQHSQVHARALAQVRAGGDLSDETEEVLATFRALAQIQQRFGPDAARRYVVSFTRSAADIAAVFELAQAAVGDRVVLDVIPLFETGDDLARSVEVLDEALSLPPVRHRLSATGRRMEVMVGYSDSAKDIGPVSATLALYDAQARLARWAARHAISLTLFHGRGGALGRGGGPVNRAVLAQPPGSVSGRFKVTEQGEVIFARYGDPELAMRHLEQVASAALIASTPSVEQRTSTAAREFAPLAATLFTAAREAYWGLVRRDGFADWFVTATALDEIGRLPLGSRPARRGLSVDSLDDLRAIPWVFSWAQCRANVPGWYGLGTALEAVGDTRQLRRAYAEWPLFTVLVDNAEMSLAKADPRILTRYVAPGGREDIVSSILDEYERSVAGVLALTGHSRLLENHRVLGRAVQLRNPYIDALSYLQMRALREVRDCEAHENPDPVRVESLHRLVRLTVNGVAAGLQNTG
jgi:phosphoenolpyruvate carboxylase